MTPGKYNFTVFRGTTHRMSLTLKQDNAAWDLTGYTATMVIGSVVTLTSSPPAGLTITPTTGVISVAISPTDTSKIYNSQHYYLTVTSGSDTYAVLHGTITGELP